MPAKYTKFSQLPREVTDFLVSDDGQQQVLDLMETHGIDSEHLDELYDLVEAVIFGETQLDDVPAAFALASGLSSETGNRAMLEFLSLRLLPIADAVGIDVASAMKRWGASADVSDQVNKVTVIGPTPETKSGARISDPVLQHRLELIAASYRDGVRTREQAVAVLMRPIKTGGLEMGEQAANDVLMLVSSELGEPKKPEPEEKKVEVPPEPAAVPAVPVVEPSNTGAKSDEFTKADEEEIKQITETKRAVIEQPTLITDTKAAAEKIAADAKLSFATGELKTRFEHIIDARLRDVRDGFETRAKLEAATDQGGVGLAGTQLVAVMEMVEAMDAMHHKALAAGMEQKKQQALVEKVERAQMAEKVQAQEAQVMAKRYAEITGKAPTELVSPTPSRPTAAPAAEAVQQREQQIDTAKVKAAIEAAKVPGPSVTPVLSEASIPTAPSGRPKVEDIRFERKLAGPIEELRLLTLTDFRRLSKEAKQSTQKIHDKVELVSQEGYDRRIAAIRAWRESPLSLMYVALSREALIAGKGIAQILAEKRAAGEDVPTDDELRAIVELNGTLRF